MEMNLVVNYTRQLLAVDRFRDYCPNGLQVEGRSEIRKIVTGVTASMELLEAAKEARADAIIVHHGYFWKNEDQRITGIKRNRIKFLLENGMNLMAYHLPLDAHQEFGNSVQLGRRLGLTLEGWAGEQDLVAFGSIDKSMLLSEFGERVGRSLGRVPMLIGDQSKLIKRVAWCTGAAQGYIDVAVELGVDVFVSGEVSEQTVHLSRETGIGYISAGHHATERYGVQSLGEHLALRFGLEHEFIDIDNPV